MDAPKPVVLMILDGWGYREAIDGNAIEAARKPTWDRLWETAPHALISGSGEDVGLPHGQMGNSEVGHMNIGAGRKVYQYFTRITKAIADGEFQTNPALNQAIDNSLENDKPLHVFGLLSPGGVHSHEDHMMAMLRLALARGVKQIYLHAILDGRDTPPRSAIDSIQRAQAFCQTHPQVKIASLVGRYYAMDRDHRWERTQKAYACYVNGESAFRFSDPVEAIEAAYHRGETDEFVQPIGIHRSGEAPITVQAGDSVVFMNFRADRARQLSRAFVQTDFDSFPHDRVALGVFVTLTEYIKDFPATVAFAPEVIVNTLPEVVAKQGLTQLRIAETEKYAHVTYFMNGGQEALFAGEQREMIASPHVATYDLLPEMSAHELTDELVKAIESQMYDLIICNYANADMVGHSGDFSAAVKAIEMVDRCLGRVVDALNQVGGEAIITADHGNAECMYDESTAQPHTAHTHEPVPIIYVGQQPYEFKQAKGLMVGTLADIAPTVLQLMHLEKPQDMTGVSLLTSVN